MPVAGSTAPPVFIQPPRLAGLSPASIRSNSSYRGSVADVPRCAFTLGLATFLEARRLVLIASGAHKTSIFERRTPNSLAKSELHATIVHRHCAGAVIADREAASDPCRKTATEGVNAIEGRIASRRDVTRADRYGRPGQPFLLSSRAA